MDKILFGATYNRRTGLWGASAHIRQNGWQPQIAGVGQFYKTRRAAIAAVKEMLNEI